MNDKCPLCGEEFFRVIYYGLPYKFCVNEDCNCMWGGPIRNFLARYLPFNGYLYVYWSAYPLALLKWLLKIDDK